MCISTLWEKQRHDMFRAIYTYELTKLLKQPATYIYFAFFFTIALLNLLGTAGFFDEVPPTDKEARWLNSAHEINSIFQYFTRFFLFLLPAICGMVIYKDFKNNLHSVLYAYPIPKSAYLLGKFCSALTIVFLLTFSVGIALFCGEVILGQNNPMIGPTTRWGCTSAYLLFVFPTLLVFGLIVFSVVGTLRNSYAGFMVVILLFLFKISMDNLLAGNPMLSALFDPFGQNAVAYETHYWTIAEQNTRQIPIGGIVLWNRALWVAIGLLIFGFFYKKFQLEQETFLVSPSRLRKKKTRDTVFSATQPGIYHRTETGIDLTVRQQLLTMLRLSGFDFRYMIKNWLFYVLLLFAILALVFALSRVTNRGDMAFLPLTRIMLSLPMFFFSTVVMLLTFIYAGMLVQRSQMAGINQLIDTTATANWVFLGSKILALLQVQVVLLFVMMLCGIGLQLYNGYYHVELGLYLYQLFLLTFPTLVIWAVISVFTYTILPNVYLGLFLLLLVWLGKDHLPQLGITSHLLRFNSTPPLIYSDLNGFGHALGLHHILNAYWLSFAGFVLVLSYLFWNRGFSYSAQERVKQAFQRFQGFAVLTALLFVSHFCFWGLKLYREENSPFKPVGNTKQVLENFRANFGKYTSIDQPKIVSVKLNIELFPESTSFTARGEYVLINKTSQKLDTLLIKTGFDEITEYSFPAPSRLIREDKKMQFAVHVLRKPLFPNDSLRMHFEIKSKPNTLFYQNSAVLHNGTFLGTDVLPRLGYFFDTGSREPWDSLARVQNVYSPDADLVTLETTISTHPLQTALAPGVLQKQWTENGRNYFHYQTKDRIKFAFAFNSGVFSVSKTNYHGVDLDIYHHKHHPFSLKDMTNGLKAALDYNTYFFGPFQHSEVRVVEFPLTQGSFASVMGSTIPTSEVRFIEKNKDVDNRVSLSFYVQAHELTHQWWGNQVVPADALGAKMLTESIAEYITLRIYERHFGQEKTRHFLSLQRKRYLEGRARETDKENPLYRVRSEQEYIAYGKGAMAFNTLHYFVGEERLNGILKAFLEKYKFKTDHYPTTLDLVAHLKKFIPPDLHYIIHDMIESITFYDNQIKNVKELPDHQLEVTIMVKKLDSEMKKELDAPTVCITIGQYDEAGNLLHTEIRRVSSGENKLILRRKPKLSSIVLDPYLHFIELTLDDNKKYLRHPEQKPARAQGISVNGF
jgi:ABC-2 type transport system permease protein